MGHQPPSEGDRVMRKWDVIVGGAGPAGSRVAELLARVGLKHGMITVRPVLEAPGATSGSDLPPDRHVIGGSTFLGETALVTVFSIGCLIGAIMLTG